MSHDCSELELLTKMTYAISEYFEEMDINVFSCYGIEMRRIARRIGEKKPEDPDRIVMQGEGPSGIRL